MLLTKTLLNHQFFQCAMIPLGLLIFQSHRTTVVREGTNQVEALKISPWNKKLEAPRTKCWAKEMFKSGGNSSGPMLKRTINVLK